MIRLSKSVINSTDIDAVTAVLQKGYLGMGEEVKAFEEDLKVFLGCSNPREVVCVNNGTGALHLALQAVGIGVGDEVLVPSLTYLASFQAISATGATPISCDVLEDNALIDLADAEKRLTPSTKAIMPVHYASNMGNLQSIYTFAKKHNLRVLEDAAHAFGCSYNNQLIGSFGDIVCFSFDGIKNITSGEGGAVVSADKDVLERVKDARLLGVEKDTEKRYLQQRSWDFNVREQGWRYHMSDIMAAIGRSQLRRFKSEFKPKRVALAKYYRDSLGSMNELKLFDVDLDTIVPHIQPVRILNGRRDELKDQLLKENIQSGIHYKPNHLLTKYGAGIQSLPMAEKLYKEIISLPLHPELTEKDIDKIVSVVRSVLS